MELKVEDFHREIGAALRAYEKYVVCLNKTPDEFLKTLHSLVGKAITAFVNRAPGLRHGIALDRYVTVMISEQDDAPPVCGIYFNLHSPYVRKMAESKKSKE